MCFQTLLELPINNISLRVQQKPRLWNKTVFRPQDLGVLALGGQNTRIRGLKRQFVNSQPPTKHQRKLLMQPTQAWQIFRWFGGVELHQLVFWTICGNGACSIGSNPGSTIFFSPFYFNFWRLKVLAWVCFRAEFIHSLPTAGCVSRHFWSFLLAT